MLPAAVAAVSAVGSVVVAAGPAQAASRLIVRGAGFGHGVGMSQWGAYGFAMHGKDHAFILGHYYTGTQLARLAGPTDVRVLLRSGGTISFSGATAVAGGGRRLSAAQTYTGTRSLGSIVLRTSAGRSLGTYKSPLRVTGAPTGVLVRGRASNGVTNGRYRGDLELRAGALGVSAIDVVSLEDYVRGVVAGEMPPSWPAAALQAQATAARTYALATAKDGDGFDQYADTRSQMYPGISGETPTTDAAVAATAGEVVAYQGKPVVTYYFSTSGGQTENVENSFIGATPEPWLVSVDDPYDSASPRHRWRRQMTLGSADARLGGLVKGDLRQIKVLQRGRSPRVVRAQVVGSGGTTNVTGPQLRAKLGLYDTWARFTVITASGSRGDGNTPKPTPTSPPASPPATTTPAGPGTGGAAPRIRAASRSSVVGGLDAAASALATARETAGARVAGVVSGRVAPAGAGRWVALERYAGGRWVAQFETPTLRGGRYRATVPLAGMYRVRFAGEAGPPVRVG
ncbi:MAG TPA: SpoIID/LytB domain-containing protein [Solirubrobacteraceae bacterium]|jgi:stage II sporulation protein D|nr:SpoIID/LytB domain-containing protein [Solirubrobacteraceae bacterium]